jgi:Zn finger protein HypA/HybF involved in hydrogenase expression
MLKSTKKKTREEFTEASSIKHSNRYDYSKVDYINSQTKVIIICDKHGEFQQTPASHLFYGHGCPKCRKNSLKTTEEFITEARIIHRGVYDYSRVNYFGTEVKIEIICDIHGSFWQTASSHRCGKSCPKCASEASAIRQRLPHESVVENFIKIHGNTYDYTLVDYINNRAKVKIGCSRHGIFLQSPANHKKGSGCPRCSAGNISKLETQWLDSLGVPDTPQNRQVWIKIHGKRLKVDGYVLETNTIYEFWGDYFHGNPKTKDPNGINEKIKKTFGKLYQGTEERRKLIIEAGYNLVEIWESEWVASIKSDR